MGCNHTHSLYSGLGFVRGPLHIQTTRPTRQVHFFLSMRSHLGYMGAKAYPRAGTILSTAMQNGNGHTPDVEAAEKLLGGYNDAAKAPAVAPKRSVLSSGAFKAFAYGLMNVVSASGIVFANKYVFTKAHFPFTYALTWIHTVFTLVGMVICAKLGMFEHKPLPFNKLVPLAAAYVAYIVLGNLSLNVNTVGFYQVMKIAVAPTVIFLELLMFRTLPSRLVIASVGVVCIGIAVATVTDSQLIRNLYGVAVGVAATLGTALYQIWAGSKQKELKASSMQLLHAYTPHATVMLGILVPMLEPMGWAHLTHSADTKPDDGTLFGYQYSGSRALAILISSSLGLLVSLSTFLFIGATSSLTYNVVGHMKTVIILTGGCLFFGDTMPPKKFTGVCIAMLGIIWYSHLKLVASGHGGKGQDHKQRENGTAVEHSSFKQSSSAAGLSSRHLTINASSKQRVANNAQSLLNAS